ncbi:MAG: diguanylate cyclase, partial [Chloroflexota bacterium]
AEEAVIHARDYYLTLLAEFPALIWRSGLDAKRDYFNQTWLNFTGRTAEQEAGDGWSEGVHPEDLHECVSTYLNAFAARQPFQMEYRLRRFDGEYRWIKDLGYPYYGLSREFEGYIGSCYDITEQKQNEAYIRDLAYRDSLTGLYNRKAFQERLEQELVRARRNAGKVAVLFLDLDNFKEVNDRFGHEAGDQVLCMVAQRLQDELRSSDMVARLGGDEFTILLTDLKGPDDPSCVAERIFLSVKRPLTIEGNEGNAVEVSTSIGISHFPEDGSSAKELLNKADQRMFRNKRKEKTVAS